MLSCLRSSAPPKNDGEHGGQSAERVVNPLLHLGGIGLKSIVEEECGRGPAVEPYGPQRPPWYCWPGRRDQRSDEPERPHAHSHPDAKTRSRRSRLSAQ